MSLGARAPVSISLLCGILGHFSEERQRLVRIPGLEGGLHQGVLVGCDAQTVHRSWIPSTRLLSANSHFSANTFLGEGMAVVLAF